MPPVVLIGLAAAVGLVLFAGGRGARSYTLADLPKLRELALRKSALGRELKSCLLKQTEHSLFNANQTISFGVGLFVGVATGNPNAGMQAARAASAGLEKAHGSAPACQKEFALTEQQLAGHDALCRELGLPIDVTYEQVAAIALRLSPQGFNTELPGDLNGPSAIWNRCVHAHGVDSCKASWIEERNPIPKYDPKTGLVPLP